MKVLLVTTTNKLAEKFAALSPELEYCAVVVDEIEPAKEILSQIGLPPDLLQPMSELQNCVKKFQYDYVLRVQDHPYKEKIMKELVKYGVPLNKVVSFAALQNKNNFKTEQVLRYFKEHSKEFEMFATGISPAFEGLDVTQFKRPLFNFAKPSQDLYYDYNIAKHIVLCGGGHSTIRYALIGLAPYSFHYDLSKIFGYRCLLLSYFIAFNDIHNFFMPGDVYKKFLREEWLEERLPLSNFKVKRPYGGGSNKVMDQKAIEAKSNTWAKKFYPETRDENIKILDDYLTLCEENNIRPIMFRVIVSEKYMANFNKQLLEDFDILIEQACQKHSSARFFDGWKLDGFTYDDFFDHAHMNVHGAAKFSAYFNDFIEQLEK